MENKYRSVKAYKSLRPDSSTYWGFFILNMPTVQRSLEYFCKKTNVPMPPTEIIGEIGNMVKEHYFSRRRFRKWGRITKIKQMEGGIEYNVLRYPKKFGPEIDKVIAEFSKS